MSEHPRINGREYVMPPETLADRIRSDGSLWKIAYEEGVLAGRAEERERIATAIEAQLGAGNALRDAVLARAARIAREGGAS